MRRIPAAICIATLMIFFASPPLTKAQGGPAVTTGFAEVENGKLYYEIAGDGPAVVLIHGGQLDCRMWDEPFALLARHYRVIRFDVRGFGKSPAATKPYAWEEDLLALLNDLKVDKATIIGLSLGGRIAIDFALAHSERTRAIVSVAPGLSGFDFSSDPDFLPTLDAAQTGDWEKVADIWLRSGYMAPAMENPKIAQRIRQLAIDNVHENLDNFLLLRQLKPPAIARLPQIHVPTFIIVGSRDVNDIHEIAGLLYARIPGAGEIAIAGSGHMVNLEKPEAFNRAVSDFLGQLH